MADHLLLARPADAAMRIYYDKLSASGIGPGVRVEQIGGALGKGLFADREFEGDDLVLREPKLVGAQHTVNKADALVCSFCFRYIGSIELQIGRRLLSAADEHHDHFHGSPSMADQHEHESCSGHVGGSEASQMDMGKNGDDAMEEGCESEDFPEEKKPIAANLVNALLTGDLHLPESELFPLASIVSCPGGCSDELFCSDACAEDSWNCYHALLCTGERSMCYDKNSLLEFKTFADETNDIFHVAAQVLAGTMLETWRLKNESIDSQNRGKQKSAEPEEYDILVQAWEPFAMGHKKLWWEAVALPSDISPADETGFRDQIKGLASKSLSLLKAAIFKEEFAPLFSLEVYGHIIGMFEQNNLEIVVPSPVEDYFIYIDDLPPLAKAQADRVTRPFLQAFGSDYATYCQGTGFFPLQSCINHSCQPNVKAFKRDEDRDGHAVLLALRCIEKGEEITISYIDEDAGLEERQAMLADYGFVCCCPRCVEEKSQSLSDSSMF